MAKNKTNLDKAFESVRQWIIDGGNLDLLPEWMDELQQFPTKLRIGLHIITYQEMMWILDLYDNLTKVRNILAKKTLDTDIESRDASELSELQDKLQKSIEKSIRQISSMISSKDGSPDDLDIVDLIRRLGIQCRSPKISSKSSISDLIPDNPQDRQAVLRAMEDQCPQLLELRQTL